MILICFLNWMFVIFQGGKYESYRGVFLLVWILFCNFVVLVLISQKDIKNFLFLFC